MKIFKSRCTYSRLKIERGKEIFSEIKIPEFKEKKKRPFCCKEHIKLYELEMENKKSCNKGCC